jgi:hypothetical protein
MVCSYKPNNTVVSDVFWPNINMRCNILGFHGGDYEESSPDDVMMAIRSSETSVLIRTTQHHIPNMAFFIAEAVNTSDLT